MTLKKIQAHNSNNKHRDNKLLAKEIISVARSLYSDARQFGIYQDGWSKTDLKDLIKLMHEFQKVSYELDNARRGAYAIKGDTLQDLVNKLEELRDNLENEIDNISEFIK